MTRKVDLGDRDQAREEATQLAERMCLLFGWSPARDLDSARERALYVLWRDWLRAYRAAGGSDRPRDHPELSDEAINDLARRRWEGVGPY